MKRLFCFLLIALTFITLTACDEKIFSGEIVDPKTGTIVKKEPVKNLRFLQALLGGDRKKRCRTDKLSCGLPQVTRSCIFIQREAKFVRSKKAYEGEKSNKVRFFNKFNTISLL